MVQTYQWQEHRADVLLLRGGYASVDHRRPPARSSGSPSATWCSRKTSETGELAFKPVLRTTIGPPIELVKVKAGEDTIQCTGGHAFWVPGSGWTHARKLDPQTLVHGVAGAAEIDSVGPGTKQETYNLVVADWNTYFVGRGKLLVHDVTLPGPTTTDVPGLKAL